MILLQYLLLLAQDEQVVIEQHQLEAIVVPVVVDDGQETLIRQDKFMQCLKSSLPEQLFLHPIHEALDKHRQLEVLFEQIHEIRELPLEQPILGQALIRVRG